METAQDDDGASALQLVFRSKNVDLAAARQSLRDWASASLKVHSGLVADLELASTELLTNAREATSDPNSPVWLSVEVTDNKLEVTVRNFGSLFEPPLAALSAADERGRGLAIVRSLSDDLVIRQERDTIAVSARFDLIEPE